MIAGIFQNAFSLEKTDSESSGHSTLWALGTTLLLFPALNFVITTLWLTLGGSISVFPAWAILIGSALGASLVCQHLFPGSSRLTPVGAAALLIGALLATGLMQDTSIDGQHYHFQAFYALAEGWNPLHGTAPPPVIGDPITPWPIHYPRGGWLLSANLLAAGLPLASVKALNLIVLIATAALVAAALLRAGFSRLFTLALTAAAVLNPVVISQLFTSMNDGVFGLCMLAFAVSIVAWVRLQHWPLLVPGIAAMMLALNLKFSAIPVFVMLCAIACAGAFMIRGRHKVIALAGALMASALVAIVLLGWSPYMQNFLDHGHIFHPVMGEKAVDIMTGEGPALDNTPDILKDKSGIERFFFSMFSETHSGYYTTPGLKPPFTLSPAELRASGGVDVRLAGFGPFFSGIFILSVLGAVALAVRASWRNPVTLGLLFVAGGFLLSVVLMPQNWWARYVPQFWFVPVAIAAAAVASNLFPLRILGSALAALILFNATIVGAASTMLALNRDAEAAAQIERLAATGTGYCVYPDMVQSRILRMREAGLTITYKHGDEMDCANPEEIAGYGPDRYGGKICACEGENQ